MNSPDNTSSEPFTVTTLNLSWREWLVAGCVVIIFVCVWPRIWQSIEPADWTPDSRAPYAMSRDYWQFDRSLDLTSAKQPIVLLGDSVVWGEYVRPSATLSHFLDVAIDGRSFLNRGVNGTHPLALTGLIDHYTGPISDRAVILHCNLLWMSDAERDLSSTDPLDFNHPRLVPQWPGKVPTYHNSVNNRLGYSIDRMVPYRGWVQHMRLGHFDGQDVHGWSIDHPYEIPAVWRASKKSVLLDQPHSRPISWEQRSIRPQNFPWIGASDSLQWKAFQDVVQLLRRRQNKLFVIVGPLNEHMLTEESRERYHKLRGQVETWLQDEQIAFISASLLPSPLYADASHPLAAGYEQMAKQLCASNEFQKWLEQTGPLYVD